MYQTDGRGSERRRALSTDPAWNMLRNGRPQAGAQNRDDKGRCRGGWGRNEAPLLSVPLGRRHSMINRRERPKDEMDNGGVAGGAGRVATTARGGRRTSFAATARRCSYPLIRCHPGLDPGSRAACSDGSEWTRRHRALRWNATRRVCPRSIRTPCCHPGLEPGPISPLAPSRKGNERQRSLAVRPAWNASPDGRP